MDYSAQRPCEGLVTIVDFSKISKFSRLISSDQTCRDLDSKKSEKVTLTVWITAREFDTRLFLSGNQRFEKKGFKIEKNIYIQYSTIVRIFSDLLTHEKLDRVFSMIEKIR